MILQRQMRTAGRGRRFSPALVRGVAHRCRHGCPQVILCGALRGREPFPTSFWLVCPHLLRTIGRAEAENGVAGMERFLSASGAEAGWLRHHVSHVRLRLALLGEAQKDFLRARRRGLYRAICRGGVGGISYAAGEVFVKCLHLQAASHLGMRGHPAAEWLRQNIESWECETGACAEPV